eukprot:1450855-Rhodomonas_salina.1
MAGMHTQYPGTRYPVPGTRGLCLGTRVTVAANTRVLGYRGEIAPGYPGYRGEIAPVGMARIC